jgi:hypothetical protein
VPEQAHARASLQLRSGAKLYNGRHVLRSLRVDAGNQPISIAGITAVTQPYDGQFIQIDVVSIQPQ